MKRTIISMLLLISSLLLVGCNKGTESSQTRKTLLSLSTTTSNTVTLPDLSGLDREHIEEVLNAMGIEFLFGFDQTRYYGNGEYNKFIRYQNRNIGDEIPKDSVVKVLTSPLELPEIDYKSELAFTRDLEGKSFINDSYGYVTWTDGTYADGDTTTFTDVVTGEKFRVRFLCIDTNEVSHSASDKGQPWGTEAGNYIKERLRNAKKIWVESESDTETNKETYGRYLGYVWVDGSCLNFEMIGEAYSNYTGNSRSCKYHSVFDRIESMVMASGRRFYGEYDPNYKY